MLQRGPVQTIWHWTHPKSVKIVFVDKWRRQKPSPPPVLLDMERVTSLKILGVTFTNRLLMGEYDSKIRNSVIILSLRPVRAERVEIHQFAYHIEFVETAIYDLRDLQGQTADCLSVLECWSTLVGSRLAERPKSPLPVAVLNAHNETEIILLYRQQTLAYYRRARRANIFWRLMRS